MSELVSLDQEYKEWIRSVSQKYRQSQIKAAVSVNRELIAFYWDLGRDISEREKKWGTGFYKRLSGDMKSCFLIVTVLQKETYATWSASMNFIHLD